MNLNHNNFNAEQLKAITTNSQYVRVIAGAGTGKTSVLINRIIYLVNQLKVEPSKILVLTYTNKAANEIQNRIFNLTNGNLVLQILTFHSFCLKFLRNEISFLNMNSNFTIFDRDDVKKVVTDICKKNNCFNVKNVIDYISNQKRNYGHDTFSENQINYSLIFDEYEKFKVSNNALDFDDLIIKSVEILQLSNEIREKWQNLIDCVLIDEFQDTDDIQFELIKLISKDTTSFFVVGDPNQTIYSWRGANQKIIIDFDKNFNHVETIYLIQNYRSTKQILKIANTLIACNQIFSGEELFTKNTNPENVHLFISNKHFNMNESQYVVNKIIELKEKNKIDFKNIAILYRSAYLATPFENELIKQRIPYRVFGNISFFQREEIKDVMSYFRLIINHHDNIAFERIINVPKRKIGQKSIDLIKDGSFDLNLSYYEYVQKHNDQLSKTVANSLLHLIQTIEETRLELVKNKNNSVSILKKFLDIIGYSEYLKSLDNENKIKNLDLLFKILGATIEKDTSNDLSIWLQNCMLMNHPEELEDGDFVSLMTIHTAKGLEFDCVFVIGMNEMDFPYFKRCFNNIFLEEERRLCYVAYTRAKKILFITSSGVPSRFIFESGLVNKLTANYSL